MTPEDAPLTEMRKTLREASLGEKSKSSILDMSSMRCLSNVKKEKNISSGQVDVGVQSSKKKKNLRVRDKNLEMTI